MVLWVVLQVVYVWCCSTSIAADGAARGVFMLIAAGGVAVRLSL